MTGGSSWRGSSEKVKMVASAHFLGSLNSQKIPLDQLLIKAITKLCEKKSQVGGGFVASMCMGVCFCLCETGA